jgi:hypothetical protein
LTDSGPTAPDITSIDMSRPDRPPMRAWSIRGDPELLTDAADRLRCGIVRGVYRSQPPGEYAMFGIARLLDSLAHSMRHGAALHHDIVSSATEVARHVITYLPSGPPQLRSAPPRASS